MYLREIFRHLDMSDLRISCALNPGMQHLISSYTVTYSDLSLEFLLIDMTG